MKKLRKYIFPFEMWLMVFTKLKAYCILAKDIGWQNAYHDLVAVTRGLWFFLIFQVFGALAFVLLSQGKDVLQCLLEDVYGDKYIPFFVLVAGTWFWSLASEFGSRMLLYLTNSYNSGITPDRKRFRRQSQTLIPLTQAMFPFLLYMFALSETFSSHEKSIPVIVAFASLFAFLYLNLSWAMQFYLGPKRANNPYFTPRLEFQKKLIGNLENILTQRRSFVDSYPAEITKKMYEDIKGTEPPEIRFFFRRAFCDFYKWSLIYFFTTALLFVCVGFAFSDKVHYMMGTAGIMAIGFTCWLISFFSVKIFELTNPFEGKFKFLNLPYTSILFIWLLVVSFSNNDHPINFKSEKLRSTRPILTPKPFFNAWYNFRKDRLYTDSVTIAPDTNGFFSNGFRYKDSIPEAKRIVQVPVLLIAAEGGALRTGCFTSLLLAAIQDSFPNFKNKILAYSTVSGGSFGANIFNVMADEKNRKNDSLVPLYTNYYKNVDFLAPVAAKLFFGDFINYFIPSYIEKLDREVALETAWRNSWRSYLSNSDDNLLYDDFYYSTRTDGSKPAVLINSTVVETGHRAIISNMKLDTSYFKNVFDLNERMHDNISYATAISLSARFPLVSPGGMLKLDDSHKVHLVDGGYFDNQGSTTLLELLNGLTFDPVHDSIQVIPYVLQTVFDAEKEQNEEGVSMLNELVEIVTGIYQTRNGHTVYANQLLKEKVSGMGGCYLELPVAHSTEDIPNNWILSSFAVDKAHKRVRNLMLGKNEAERDRLIRFLQGGCK